MPNTPSPASCNTADAKSAVGNCPARQAEIFIVPARYALGEEAITHSSLSPPIGTKSQPTALRKLRQGYLYLWHGDGPLRRFAVAQDGLLIEQALDQGVVKLQQGELAGLALDKTHDAWLMHSEAPLSQTAMDTLADSRIRRHRMQRIGLTEVARRLESDHCPALTDADKVIAELTPQARQKAMAYDYGQNGEEYQKATDELGQRMSKEPNPEYRHALQSAYISACNWTGERAQAAHQYPEYRDRPPGDWSAEAWSVTAAEAWLSKARTQAAELHTVFAALDDDPGMLRDLNYAQAKASEREEAWDQQNAFKGLIAGFINSLIKEDGAELAGQINYRYRERDILLSPEEGEILLQVQRELKPLLDEETEVNVRQRHRIGHPAADARIADIKRREEQVLAPTRAFIPVDLHGQLQDVVMHYRAEKARNMTDSKSGAQVAQRVRLDLMQSWIDNVAEPHREWLTSRRDNLLSDSKSLFARQTKSLWYADYLNLDHCNWLAELSLNSLSELCSTPEGVWTAADLLRAPNPSEPFSLLASGFSPELASFVDAGDRLNDIQAALEAETAKASGALISALVSQDKLMWLRGITAEGNNWGLTVSRLSSAFLDLQTGHLSGQPQLPTNSIQQFPKPLQAVLLVMHLSGKFAIKTGQAGFVLSGATGQALWNWAQDAGQRLRRGITPSVNALKGLNTFGGALPLAALALHIANVAQLNARDQNREHDAVRQREHQAENLKVAAALSAVIGGAWEATGRVEAKVQYKNIALKAPIVTLFGFFTGGLAVAGAFFDLMKLSAEMQKANAYWTADHWARLGHDSAMTGLMTTQAGLGGYATWMALTSRWTSAEAIAWFGLRMTPVSWLVLLVEGLYFAWNHWIKDSPLQAFLEQCTWGNAPRWGDAPQQQSQELHALLTLLFKPHLQAQGGAIISPVGFDGAAISGYRTDQLELTLPAASPTQTQLYLCLAAIDERQVVTDYTAQWLGTAQSQWLPIQQGMGLRLSGAMPSAPKSSHWQLRVLYHSPIATLTGVLNTEKMVVGGNMGMRYIIKGSRIVEHRSQDGRLPSDSIASMQVTAAQLQPKELT